MILGESLVMSQGAGTHRSAARTMRIQAPGGYRAVEEVDLMDEILAVRGCRVLELGCGAAWTTRLLTGRLGAASVTATEVDRVQHEKNLALGLPDVTFRYGGAEAIAEPDGSFDRVVMLKSLHHVPLPWMGLPRYSSVSWTTCGWVPMIASPPACTGEGLMLPAPVHEGDHQVRALAAGLGDVIGDLLVLAPRDTGPVVVGLEAARQELVVPEQGDP
jgi:SAM-dependent methyltransferase